MPQPLHTLSRFSVYLAVTVLLGGALFEIAGTDLVLPAIPSLPATLGGTETSAQFVIAAFVAGVSLGFIVFGELGASVSARTLVIGSLASYAVTSGLAALAPSIEILIPLRFIQGFAGAAPAVFAPGFIRVMFAEAQAVSMLGAFSSIEALVPALAPIVGTWLLVHYGWQSTFLVIAVGTGLIAAIVTAVPSLLPQMPSASAEGSYGTLLRSPVYLRYALSQALALGGILIFVFGAPTVITTSLGGSLDHFVIIQFVGVMFYILGATLCGRLSSQFGTERLIVIGSVTSLVGAGAMCLYALTGGTNPALLPIPWVIVNFGFGLRSPTTFYKALEASPGNTARGAALMFLGILLVSALGTAAVAPFITTGLVPLTSAMLIVIGASGACLLLLRG